MSRVYYGSFFSLFTLVETTTYKDFLSFQDVIDRDLVVLMPKQAYALQEKFRVYFMPNKVSYEIFELSDGIVVAADLGPDGIGDLSQEKL